MRSLIVAVCFVFAAPAAACTQAFSTSFEQLVDDRDQYLLCLIQELELVVRQQAEVINAQSSRLLEIEAGYVEKDSALMEMINGTDKRHVLLQIELGIDPMTGKRLSP